MIGVYDYTVVLTYLSLLSGSMGIVVSLSGKGHPYFGVFFLLFCGLCDAFDGRVAASKKKRSDFDKQFGIQIDSLSDLVAFGLLPAAIGVALFRRSYFIYNFFHSLNPFLSGCIEGIIYVVLLFYILCALIRLAYFNVTEEERQKKEKNSARKYYVGLPVTSSAILIPTFMLIQFFLPIDITALYFLLVLGIAIAFISKFHLKKLELRGILFFVFIGAIEFLIFLLIKIYR